MTIRGTDTLVIALAAGKKVADAAAEAGIAERTAYRRLQDPHVQQQIKDARAALFDRAFGAVAASMDAAVETLTRNLTTASPAVQVRAALGLLDRAVTLRASEEWEQLMAGLEATFGDETEVQRATA